MDRDFITRLFRSFEDIAHREGDTEFWLARELQELLGYAKWSNFEAVLAKARTACENAGHPVADHFADVGKMVDLGSGAKRELLDVALTRYARKIERRLKSEERKLLTQTPSLEAGKDDTP